MNLTLDQPVNRVDSIVDTDRQTDIQSQTTLRVLEADNIHSYFLC